MKNFDVRDCEGKGTYITFKDKESAEVWLDCQKDRLDKNSSRYGMHIVEVDRLTLSEMRDKAFAIANNAIYFNDRSDYLSALYDICKILRPDLESGFIGNEYIEE